MLGLATHGLGDGLVDMVESERGQHNLLSPRASFADSLQRPQKRVRGTDLVVPVGADQHQVPHVGIRNQALQQLKSCRVQPLQIVEEQSKRMLWPGERAKEPPEYQL